MEFFSIRNAWRYGVDFLSGRMLHHFVILLGLGIVPAYCLPLALGTPAGEQPAPVLAAQNVLGMLPPGGAAAALVLAFGYVLQTASYFASWRRGLSRNGSLGGAIGFGLLAGLLAAMIYVALIVAATVAADQIGAFGAWLLGILVLLFPLAAAFAVFYTLFAALVAVGLATALILAMIFGALMGDIGFAATLVGGSGMITVVLLVMSAILLWLAARFSCTTSVMADRRSFNLIGAMRESWRLTLDEQWVIARYLGLIAFASRCSSSASPRSPESGSGPSSRAAPCPTASASPAP